MSEFGDLLRHARAYKGVTLREAERATKINRHHLAALEREEFGDLPPLIYARGIVRNYAQYLGLDPVAALALFEEVHGQRSGGFRVVPAVKPLDIPSHWAPNFAVIAFMVVMSAVIFAWIYSAFFAPSSGGTPTPPPTQLVGAADATPTSTVPVIISPAQGGGEATPPATPSTVEVASTPTSEPEATPTSTPEPAEHTFVVSVTQTLWVEVTVDGVTEFSAVMSPGAPQTFRGKSMSIVSGNAPSVLVSVDGVDQGPLGVVWDATQTYPLDD